MAGRSRSLEFAPSPQDDVDDAAREGDCDDEQVDLWAESISAPARAKRTSEEFSSGSEDHYGDDGDGRATKRPKRSNPASDQPLDMPQLQPAGMDDAPGPAVESVDMQHAPGSESAGPVGTQQSQLPHFQPSYYPGLLNRDITAITDVVERAKTDSVEQRKLMNLLQHDIDDASRSLRSSPVVSQKTEKESPQLAPNVLKSIDFLTEPLESTELHGTIWTPTEKEIFFGAVSRYGRDWAKVSGVFAAAGLGDGWKPKSAIDCQQYARILELEPTVPDSLYMNDHFLARPEFALDDVEVYSNMAAAFDVDDVVDEVLDMGAARVRHQDWLADLAAEVELAGDDLAVLDEKNAHEIEAEYQNQSQPGIGDPRSQNGMSTSAGKKSGAQHRIDFSDSDTPDPDAMSGIDGSSPSASVVGPPSLLSRIPAAELLRPANFIRLSSRVFMNPNPDLTGESSRWDQIVAEAGTGTATGPSMTFSCLEDFASIVRALTRYLVGQAIDLANIRIRHQTLHQSTKIQRQDIVAAVVISGLSPIAAHSGSWVRKFWQKVPRRCRIAVEDRDGKLMEYDDVESMLGADQGRKQKDRSSRARSADGTPTTDTLHDSPIEATKEREPAVEAAEPSDPTGTERRLLMDELLIDEFVEARDEWRSEKGNRALIQELNILVSGLADRNGHPYHGSHGSQDEEQQQQSEEAMFFRERLSKAEETGNRKYAVHLRMRLRKVEGLPPVHPDHPSRHTLAGTAPVQIEDRIVELKEAKRVCWDPAPDWTSSWRDMAEEELCMTESKPGGGLP